MAEVLNLELGIGLPAGLLSYKPGRRNQAQANYSGENNWHDEQVHPAQNRKANKKDRQSPGDQGHEPQCLLAPARHACLCLLEVSCPFGQWAVGFARVNANLRPKQPPRGYPADSSTQRDLPEPAPTPSGCSSWHTERRVKKRIAAVPRESSG